MYFYVIRQLYDRNPQLLVESQDVFKITRESSDFRSPQEIANGWYVEANIDSDTKFSALKKLLTLFGMEDELLIRYAADSNVSATEASRHGIRRTFWKQLLPQIKNTRLFANVNPTKDHWLTAGAGISGLGFTLVVTKSYVRIELAVSTSSKEANKRYFHQLYKNKSEIENLFGGELVWEELPDGKMSRIKAELQDVSLYNENDWKVMVEFLVDNAPRFEAAFRPYIDKLKRLR